MPVVPEARPASPRPVRPARRRSSIPRAGQAWAFGLALLAPGEDDTIDFAREVLPILSDKCFVCHGPDAGEHQLRLDSLATATAGGALDLDTPEDSELLRRIHSSRDPMPPEDAKPLNEDERRILAAWVRQGARYTRHWAFVPPVAAPVPGLPEPSATQAIDAFVGRRIHAAGHDFAPPADPATLARRVALVLTGLPPEPEQLDRYLADPATNYAALVEELFASPRYGEHQARYWLDAVRYGDTHGLHLDNRRGIYPYRDWVVRAFNQNLPLDQFVVEQLAGDLLPRPRLAQRVATGYVRMNPSTSEGGAIPAEFQAKNAFDRTENLGTALLGMTLICARCHTHKYDPIEQTEYYELLAFFDSTAEPPMDGNKYRYGPVVSAPADQAGWDAWEPLEEERRRLLERASAELETTEGVPAELRREWPELADDERLSAIAGPEASLGSLPCAAEARRLLARIEALQQSFTTTLVAAELPRPRTTRLLRRGEYDQPQGEALSPDVPAVMGALPEDAPRNRLGLARWLTAREHPLVARVLVNRIWQRVFGQALVRTPEDFGLQGRQPSHPELLDWLAVELHECGWDLRHLLRAMVLSRSFRQSAAWREGLDDPENLLFARGPSHRLDAEVLRDLALWASGCLAPTMGGEGVKPYQPDGMWLAMAHPASNTKKYERDQGERLLHRSLYVYWKRTSPHPMMTLFDAPDRESSCVRRSRTSTPLQSLGLLNETQRVELARGFAARLLRERPDDDARIDWMFRLLCCRAPDEAERAACRQLLTRSRARFAASPSDAQALLATGESPPEPGLDAVDQASWTQLSLTFLASDLCILLY